MTDFHASSTYRVMPLALVASLFVVCFATAMIAPNDVLNEYPTLSSFCLFVGGYAKSVEVLSTGAAYPQISRLVLALAWPAAFALWVTLCVQLSTTLYSATVQEQFNKWAGSWESQSLFGATFTVIGCLALLVTTLLTDLGFIHGIGLISGAGWSKAEVGPFHRFIFSSRLGLAIGAFTISSAAAIFYSAGLIALPFLALPRLVLRFKNAFR